MTHESLNKISSMTDSELTKLITHMENSEPDDADICRLKELLKIHKLVHDLAPAAK